MKISFKKSVNKLELHIDILLLKTFKVTNKFVYFSTVCIDIAGIYLCIPYYCCYSKKRESDRVNLSVLIIIKSSNPQNLLVKGVLFSLSLYHVRTEMSNQDYKGLILWKAK